MSKRDEGLALMISAKLLDEDTSVYWCPDCSRWWIANGEDWPISGPEREMAQWSCQDCDVRIHGTAKGREYIVSLT